MPELDNDVNRLARERDFHNRRFSEETREAQSKYYWALQSGSERYERLLEEWSRGADIFELGCAKGENIIRNNLQFRSAGGIDISDVAVETANTEARRLGKTNVHFFCGNAEQIPLPDASVDLVYGSGIVHHLNTERCIREVHRLLRPAGRAIFWEPLGHNVFFNLYRRMTPGARTDDEHPLIRTDFEIMGKLFPSLHLEFFGLTSIATVPLRNIKALRWTRKVAESIDALLFAIPTARWQAWYSLSIMTRETTV